MTVAGRPYDLRAWKRVRLLVLRRDDGRCQIRGPACSGAASVIDHIVPLKLGGAWLDPANLRAACRSCNTWRAYRSGDAAAGVPLGPANPSREW